MLIYMKIPKNFSQIRVENSFLPWYLHIWKLGNISLILIFVNKPIFLPKVLLKFILIFTRKLHFYKFLQCEKQTTYDYEKLFRICSSLRGMIHNYIRFYPDVIEKQIEAYPKDFRDFMTTNKIAAQGLFLCSIILIFTKMMKRLLKHFFKLSIRVVKKHMSLWQSIWDFLKHQNTKKI